MRPQMSGGEPGLTALLIAPDRVLAEEFLSALVEPAGFQVLADLRTYPPEHTLQIRLRQIRPEIILLDTGSDWQIAVSIIRSLVQANPPVQVVALHPENDPEAILNCLRAGASEFLHPPFDAHSQQAALSRLRRLRREPDTTTRTQLGQVAVFSSVKPGSGSSTLAWQSALAVARLSHRRVLMADFDLTGGTLAFHAGVGNGSSLVDALRCVNELSAAAWCSLVSTVDAVDLLPGPESPFLGQVESGRIYTLIEFARRNYDWTFLDLPVIFEPLSLTVLSNADRAYLVSTAELPSLHLARKAVRLLNHLGFTKDRYLMLVNRMNRRDELPRTDMEKLLNCPVHSLFPNDYFALHRTLTAGRSLDPDSELGKSITGLAGQLCGMPDAASKPASGTQPASARVC